MATMVNGERIDAGDIDAEVERLRPHYEAHVQADDDSGEAGLEQLREWATENLIERALVLQAARATPVEVPRAEIDAAYEEVHDQAGDAPAEEVKAEIELRMRVDRLMDQHVADVAEATDEELRAFYDEHRERFTAPEQVRASHVVKHVHGPDKQPAFEAAMAARMEIAGGASFEEVVTAHSDCPEDAGDLGTFGHGEMVQEFEDVVFAMKVGEVSDVFETQFGYHIAKLYEHRAAREMPFEQVRDDIARELLDSRRQEAVEAFVDSMKATATIEEVPDEPAGDT